MDYDCRLEEKQAQPTLVVRARMPVTGIKDFLGAAFGAVWTYLEQSGEAPAGMPFAAYHNMDVQDMDIEAGFPVGKPMAARGNVVPGLYPGGTHATLLYKGPYEGLSAPYAALTQFITEQGRHSDGPAYEFYFSEPTVPPEETLTLIDFPLT